MTVYRKELAWVGLHVRPWNGVKHLSLMRKPRGASVTDFIGLLVVEVVVTEECECPESFGMYHSGLDYPVPLTEIRVQSRHDTLEIRPWFIRRKD